MHAQRAPKTAKEQNQLAIAFPLFVCIGLIYFGVPLSTITDRSYGKDTSGHERRGIAFYTIGQRKGLGISSKERLYVTDLDQGRNAIIVGTKRETYRDELVASKLNWIAMKILQQPIAVKAKIRYLHKEAEALIAPLDEDKIHIKFKEPQMAITPGQAAVLYDDDTVIGGGTIERGVETSDSRKIAGE